MGWVGTQYAEAIASIIVLRLVTKMPPFDLEAGLYRPPPLIPIPSTHLCEL